ncbi:MAG TPA: TonB-dependent receptor [Caulobacteraceae bacterium]
MNARHLRRALLGTIALGALPAFAFVPSAATAQTVASNASTNLSEIVVTAEKRTEKLQETPVSVSVVSGANLEATQATSMQDWSGYVPGLQLGANGAPGLTNVALDGVAPVSAASQVGVYLNDMPVGSSSSFQQANGFTPDLMPYDLQRLEVLRGPQGTLYGASTMGGLIKYVLNDPNLETLSGRVGGDLFGVENGSGVGGGVRGEINAPLIKDQLAIHLSAYDENTPGYIDNATTGQKGDNALHQYGGRAALLWKPTADFTAELSAIYSRNHADNQAIVALDQTTLQPIAGPLSNINTLPEPYTQEFQYYEARLNLDLHWAQLTSVSSYQIFSNDLDQDLTYFLGDTLSAIFGNPGPNEVNYVQHYKLNKFTQEVRLASPGGQRVDWLVGAFYTHETGDFDQDIEGVSLPGLSLPNPLEFVTLPSTYQEYAFFGNLTIHVTNWFDLSGGLRYARNNQSFTETQTGSLTSSLVIPGTSNEGVVSYMVSPSFHLSRDTLLYARIATGYQPGGPDIVVPGVTGLPSQFQSSRLTDYQVGFKSLFLDGRASVDLSVYDIEWSKIQVGVEVSGMSGGSTVQEGIVENAGAARSRGFDLAGTWSPVPNLNLAATVSYNDARLTTDVASLYTFAGARLPYDPMWSGSLSAEYSARLTEQWRGFIGAGWRYVGSRFSAPEGSTIDGVPGGIPQGLEARAYGVVDLHLGAKTHDITISVFAKNLFDNRVYLAPQTFFNTDILNVPIDIRAPVLQPRTIGVSVDKSF